MEYIDVLTVRVDFSFFFYPFSLYLSFTLPLGVKGWCGHIPPGAKVIILQVGAKTLVSTNEVSGDTGLHMGPRGKVSWQVPGHAVWSCSRSRFTITPGIT